MVDEQRHVGLGILERLVERTFGNGFGERTPLVTDLGRGVDDAGNTIEGEAFVAFVTKLEVAKLEAAVLDATNGGGAG